MQCCDYKAGDLIHFITFELAVEVADGYGGKNVTWQEFAEVQAKVTPLSGSERFHAMRKESDITHKIIMRYSSWVDSTYRINFNGRIMEIDSVINLEERNRWIEIKAIEGEPT
jgi:SPP1 family predicted phage head-tail adaptor